MGSYQKVSIPRLTRDSWVQGHNTGMDTLKEELAAVAARLVVEEGLDYAAAKR